MVTRDREARRRRRWSGLAAALLLVGCGGASDAPPDAGAVDAAGPDAAAPRSLAELAEAAGGGDVVIEEGQDVVIDGDATMGLLVVRGVLRCAPGARAEVRADGVLLLGGRARWECGAEDARFTGEVRLLLTGFRDLDEALAGHGGHPGHALGAKALAVVEGATLSLHGDAAGAGHVRLAADLLPGGTELVLSAPVAWQPGDQVAVSTTSYRPEETERFTVVAVDGDRVTIDPPAAHAHLGRTVSYDDVADGERYVLDERAYVAGLARTIVIASDDDAHAAAGDGAHVMITAGGRAYVDAVELTRVGQRGRLARYPFHWHLSGDVAGQYLRDASIHGSANRCVTIHGTHRATVTGNTCVDHVGHGFFLEDGNETGNELAHNLGMRSRKARPDEALLVSDHSAAPGDRFPGPATYWISNPANDVHHNVAVGSEGSGFWMAFRSHLRCDAGGCAPSTPDQATVDPRTADTLRFADNVAMGASTGITWDGAPAGALLDNARNPGGDFALVATHYAPATTPTFPGLVAVKNSAAGIYFRGEQAVFAGAVLGDNGTSAFFAYNQVLRDSIVVGDSPLLGAADLAFHLDPTIDPQRRHLGPGEGIRVYDGPFVLDNVFFADFATAPVVNEGFDQSTIPIRITGAAERWVNLVRRVTFAPEPLHRLDLRLDGVNWKDSYTAGVLDELGDLTGTPGTLVRPAHPLNDDPRCAPGPLASLRCAYELSHLRFDTPGNPIHQGFRVTRSDGAAFAPADEPGEYLNKLSLIRRGGFAYQVDDLDFAGSSWMRLRFTSDAVGDVSPVVVIGSALDLPCALKDLVLDGVAPSADRAAVEAATTTAFAAGDAELVLRLQATTEKPQMTPGTPVGDAFYTLRCGP